VPAALAGPNVGVSVNINQPGVYGRVDVGNVPPPALVYPQPVIIGRPVVREPLYLYVPPEHQRDWHRYCGRYNGCGRPVYFVQERWVRERWDEKHHGRGHGHGHDDHYDRGEPTKHGHHGDKHDGHKEHGEGHGRGH
jgi:hypothetical protein